MAGWSNALLVTGGLVWAGCAADVDDVFGRGGAGSGGEGGLGTTTNASSGVATSGSTASGTTCGNGLLEPGEACDGADLGDADCTGAGYLEASGASCTPGCTLSYAGCQAVCGNGALEPGEACEDGNANPGDGCAGCQLAGVGCSAPIAVALPLGQTQLSGSTLGLDNLLSPQQSNGCSNLDGPELVYAITPQDNGFLTAWLPAAATDFDSVLYLRNLCDEQASQVLCHDNFGTRGNAGGELISLPVYTGSTVFVVVDGYDGAAGNFALSLDLSVGEDCSDPIPIEIEGSAEILVIGSSNGFASNASCLAGFGAGPDLVYALTPAQTGSYSLSVTAGYNSVLNARSNCADVTSELGCSSPPGNNGSSLTLGLASGLPTAAWVDGTLNQSGTYSLRLSH